jgi:cytochrome P450
MTNQPRTAGEQRAPANKVAPGPRGYPLLGSVPEVRRKGMVQFYVDAQHDYGDVVRLPMGPISMHLVTHPDDVRRVLVTNRQNYWKGIGMRKIRMLFGDGLFTSEGAYWQRQRKLMQPSFTPRAMGQFFPAMVDATQRMLERWQPAGNSGQTLEINDEMMRLTMSIIANTMFSMDINEQAAEAGRAFTYVLEYVSSRSVTFIDIPLSIPTPANRRFNDAMRILRDFMGGIIAERRKNPASHNDLLSMLLNAKDDTTGEMMSDQQVYDEIITIFFAGHETTAQALTWTWYLLSNHPEVEAKLHDEVDRVLNGRVPTAEDLAKLTYTRNVMNEVLRLYPSAWIFVRDSISDDALGGYHIPPKSMIVLSPYITHRHPDFWDNPEQFDPDRFTEERSANRHHYAYFPFGGGPRTCIGNNFALQEAQLAVAMVAQRHSLRMQNTEPVLPRMAGTLRPDRAVMMTVTNRK